MSVLGEPPDPQPAIAMTANAASTHPARFGVIGQ
jgi:hypothetical protein